MSSPTNLHIHCGTPTSQPNRQESHRIYVQVFAPHSASDSPRHGNNTSAQHVLHRHDSHDVHPPNYPMTSPGQPYQFSSSSDSSVSTFASYSFSSSLSSTATSANTEASGVGNHHHSHTGSSHAQNHQSRSQTLQSKTRFIAYPATSTTSAAVRLTDKARTRDVTALLRGKFGLPPISHSNKHHMQQPSHVHSALPNKLPTRLSQCQKSDSIYTAYNISCS